MLLLVAPVYMLQTYGRVLPSVSHATLLALTGVAAFLLSCFGLLDWVRQRLMTRVAPTLHAGAADAVLAGTSHASLRRARQSGGQPVRDLITVRQFLNTPLTLAFFDAPWAPVSLAVIFLIHPRLGGLTLCGTVTLLGLGMLTETRSRGPYRMAGEQAADAQRFAENGLRHADVLAAMGMYGAFRRRWHRRPDRSVAAYAEGGARLSALLATTKTVQVGTLGLGAWRVLVGVWPAQAGQVRVDSAAIGEWPAERRLQHVGSLPQEVELFKGRLAENAARMEESDAAAVLVAARLAHCHDVLMRLPERYDTAIAESEGNLSAGQRQRVGLVRAVYGDPVFVVLDEPDANLDVEGEAALLKTLQALAQRKATVVVMHTPRLLRGVEQARPVGSGAAGTGRDRVCRGVDRSAGRTGSRRAAGGAARLVRHAPPRISGLDRTVAPPRREIRGTHSGIGSQPHGPPTGTRPHQAGRGHAAPLHARQLVDEGTLLARQRESEQTLAASEV